MMHWRLQDIRIKEKPVHLLHIRFESRPLLPIMSQLLKHYNKPISYNFLMILVRLTFIQDVFVVTSSGYHIKIVLQSA